MLMFFVFLGTMAFAQSTDSLVLKEQILRQENVRYIQQARRDMIISENLADSLQTITTESREMPVQVSIDLHLQVRDYIDNRYEEQMWAVNEPVMEEYDYSSITMLPTKLIIPEDIVFPEEREAERQKLAIEQLAESIARDLEREKLPAWQQWWIDHIPFSFGRRVWYKRKVSFINGHEVAVPAGDPRDR